MDTAPAARPSDASRVDAHAVIARHDASRMSTGYGRRFRRCNAVSRILLFGCLGMALFGYDTGVVSGAMTMLREDIALDTDELETVVSVTLIWAAVTTVLGIPANTILGRKPVIVLSALLYIAGSIIIAQAAGFYALIVGRSLLGMAIGLSSGTVPMYSAELSPPNIRGIVVTLNDLNIVFGQLIASFMNIVFRNTAGGWRWSMGFASVPALLLLIGFACLPESPRWLVMKGRLTDAEAVLQMVHERPDVSSELKDILAALRAEGDDEDLRRTFGSRLRRGARKLRTLWTQKEVRRAAILGIGLMAMNQLSGINTVMYYSTTILVQAGFSRDMAIWLAALCCAAQLLGVCVSVASMDSRGRRPTALRSCAGVAVTLLLLAVSYWCHGDYWHEVKVVALMAYLIAFGSGLSGVPWVMNSEIYPLRLRSVAVGQATVLLWILNWAVGRYFLTICELLGTGGACSLFAGFSIFGGVWLYFMLPETMGLELEEVCEMFRDPYPKRWFKPGAGAKAGIERGNASSSEDSSDEQTSAESESDLAA